MSWISIVMVILSLVGPALPTILKWIESLFKRTALDMDSSTDHAKPTLYSPESAIKELFEEIRRNMSWWDWLRGRGFILSRIEVVMLNRAAEIMEYTRQSPTHYRALTDDEKRIISG